MTLKFIDDGDYSTWPMTMTAGKSKIRVVEDSETDVPVDRIQSQTRCDNDINFFLIMGIISHGCGRRRNKIKGVARFSNRYFCG